MAVDYDKLNCILALFLAAAPAVILLLEQINKASGNCYVVIDMVNVFFSILIRKEILFIWYGPPCTFIIVPYSYVNTPAPCHKID